MSDTELCEKVKEKYSNGWEAEEILSRFMKQTIGEEYPYRWRRRIK